MKFKAFLIQENKTLRIDSLEEIKKMIEQDCQPYLKELKTSVDPKRPQFYRGMYEGANSFLKKDVRKNRKPTGTDLNVYWELNKWIKKKGGASREMSVICTGDLRWAGDFGHPYMIYPVGKYKYSWIHARDVNIENISSGYSPGMLYIKFPSGDYSITYGARTIASDLNLPRIDKPEDFYPRAKKITNDWFKKKGFIHNQGLSLAQKLGYETWFECKEYYAVGIGI